MTDTTAPAAPATNWLDTVKTLGPYVVPVLLPLVTFLTGVGTTVLTHHLTRVDKLEEKQHQAQLPVPLVRLGDIEDVMKPFCGDLGRKLDDLKQQTAPQKIPTRPARSPAGPARPVL